MHKKYKHSLKTCRVTWSIGTLIVMASYCVNFEFNIVYVSYYFFLVGLFSLINSFLPYIILNNKTITVYYGIFNKKNRISIFFNQIECVCISSYSKSYSSSVGGFVRFPVRQETLNNEALLIKLKVPLEGPIRNDISNYKRKSFFNEKILTNENYTEILIKAPLEGGFKILLSDLHMAGVRSGACEFLPDQIK